MIHPDTELRLVSPEVGYGVFATRFIPRGTLTWVLDPLDQHFSPKQVAALPPPFKALLLRYGYRDALLVSVDRGAQKETYSYDDRGRVNRADETRVHYDAEGRVTHLVGGRVPLTASYSAPEGTWTCEVREGARTTRYSFDEARRTLEVAEAGETSSYTFDARQRPRTVERDGKLERSWRYDRQGRLTLLHRHRITGLDHQGGKVCGATAVNEANGEEGRDGHNANYSDNLGVEGPTDDPKIRAIRARRKRNMLATLLLSQGTPMLLAGDELGNSQGGNNNAYCQDNAIGWIDWADVDEDLLAFVRRMIAFRRKHPILRQKLFLHSRERVIDGKEDLFWRRADGTAMTEGDWRNTELRLVAVELRTASGTPRYAALESAIFAVFNGGDDEDVTLPEPPGGYGWTAAIETADTGGEARRVETSSVHVPGNSVSVFVLERDE